MLRLPLSLLDPDVVEDYCVGDQVGIRITDEFVVLDLTSEDKPGDWVGAGRRAVGHRRCPCGSSKTALRPSAWSCCADSATSMPPMPLWHPAGLSRTCSTARPTSRRAGTRRPGAGVTVRVVLERLGGEGAVTITQVSYCTPGCN
jgi:hypothetical protein